MAAIRRLSPINPDVDCAEGVKAVYAKIAALQRSANKGLKCLGVLLRRVAGKDNIHKVVRAKIRQSLGARRSPIPSASAPLLAERG